MLATSHGNGAFWSLGTEEQLYALYFLMLLMLTRRSLNFALAVAAAAPQSDSAREAAETALAATRAANDNGQDLALNEIESLLKVLLRLLSNSGAVWEE